MARDFPPDDPLLDAEGAEAAAISLAGPKTQARASFRGTFASLGYRPFVWLWLGQVTHAGALWLELIARPLLILSMTGSATHLGLIMAVRTIAAVAFGMVAGVVADSFRRRTVLLTTIVTVFIFSSMFAAILVAGAIEVWHIYVFTLLRGISMAFDQPARRAMIPSVVPAHLVTNAMALSTGSMQVMRIIGAAGAGLLIGFAGVEAAFITIAASYLLAFFFVWMLRVPDHRRSGYQGLRTMGSDIGQGLRFAWSSPQIRGVLIIALGYFAFGLTFIQVFAPLFATEVLDIGERGFGFLMAVTGVGGVVGALLLASFNPNRHRGLLMIGFLGGIGALLVLFSGTTYVDSLVLTYLVVALLGLGQAGILPLDNASLVEATPEEMRGRVLGLLSMVRAMTGFGAAGAGFMAAALGPQQAQLIFGAACVVTALAMFSAYPALRRVQ